MSTQKTEHDPDLWRKFIEIEEQLPLTLHPPSRVPIDLPWEKYTPLQQMLIIKANGNAATRKQIAPAIAVMHAHGISMASLIHAVIPKTLPDTLYRVVSKTSLSNSRSDE